MNHNGTLHSLLSLPLDHLLQTSCNLFTIFFCSTCIIKTIFDSQNDTCRTGTTMGHSTACSLCHQTTRSLLQPLQCLHAVFLTLSYLLTMLIYFFLIIMIFRYMIFKTRQKRYIPEFSIEINNTKIKRVNVVVFLGVVLDLSWKPLISHISRKISKLIGIIYKSNFSLANSCIIVGQIEGKNLRYRETIPICLHVVP